HLAHGVPPYRPGPAADPALRLLPRSPADPVAVPRRCPARGARAQPAALRPADARERRLPVPRGGHHVGKPHRRAPSSQPVRLPPDVDGVLRARTRPRRRGACAMTTIETGATPSIEAGAAAAARPRHGGRTRIAYALGAVAFGVKDNGF